jgi:hypothetical protein
MNTRDDLADASLDASLLTEFSDVFATFADDDSCVLCAHQGA